MTTTDAVVIILGLGLYALLDTLGLPSIVTLAITLAVVFGALNARRTHRLLTRFR